MLGKGAEDGGTQSSLPLPSLAKRHTCCLRQAWSQLPGAGRPAVPMWEWSCGPPHILPPLHLLGLRDGCRLASGKQALQVSRRPALGAQIRPVCLPPRTQNSSHAFGPAQALCPAACPHRRRAQASVTCSSQPHLTTSPHTPDTDGGELEAGGVNTPSVLHMDTCSNMCSHSSHSHLLKQTTRDTAYSHMLTHILIYHTMHIYYITSMENSHVHTMATHTHDHINTHILTHAHMLPHAHAPTCSQSYKYIFT